jgi:chromosome segregation ATPase
MEQLKEKLQSRKYQIEKDITKVKFKKDVLKELLIVVNKRKETIEQKIEDEEKELTELRNNGGQNSDMAKILNNDILSLNSDLLEIEGEHDELKEDINTYTEEYKQLEEKYEQIVQDELKVDTALIEGDIIEEDFTVLEEYLSDDKILDIKDLINEIDELRNDNSLLDINTLDDLDEGVLGVFGLLTS